MKESTESREVRELDEFSRTEELTEANKALHHALNANLSLSTDLEKAKRLHAMYLEMIDKEQRRVASLASDCGALRGETAELVRLAGEAVLAIVEKAAPQLELDIRVQRFAIYLSAFTNK